MMLDPTALLALSKNAIFVIVHLYSAEMLTFTMRELTTLMAGKQCSSHLLYAVIQELETHHLISHTKPAPGRPSTYHLALFGKSLSSSSEICSSDLKNNVCDGKALPDGSPKPVTLSEHDQQAVAALAKQYGLQLDFLTAKIQERGKAFDLLELQRTLAVSKQKARTDFAGYFFTAYVKRGLFSTYLAQESGYTPPQPSARVIERPETKTPYNANTNVTENLRAPVKSQEAQAQHYAKIADVIPPDLALAMDVKTLTDGLTATKKAFQAGQLTATQARTQLAFFLGTFSPNVVTAAEATIQDVMQAFDAPGNHIPDSRKMVTPPVKVAGMVSRIGARA